MQLMPSGINMHVKKQLNIIVVNKHLNNIINGVNEFMAVKASKLMYKICVIIHEP